MEIILTTCCKDKDSSKNLISAIKRYQDPRIRLVRKISSRKNSELFFLSGKFGLIHSETPIPWYDKPLLKDDVQKLRHIVKFQIKNYDIKKVYFYGESKKKKGWRPYYQLIEKACKDLGISLEIILTQEKI